MITYGPQRYRNGSLVEHWVNDEVKEKKPNKDMNQSRKELKENINQSREEWTWWLDN